MPNPESNNRILYPCEYPLLLNSKRESRKLKLVIRHFRPFVAKPSENDLLRKINFATYACVHDVVLLKTHF